MKSCFESTQSCRSKGVSKGVEPAPVKKIIKCSSYHKSSTKSSLIDGTGSGRKTEGGVAQLVLSLVVEGRSPLLFTTVGADV